MAWNCSNQFRRSGQRDDRRRLLFNAELHQGGANGSPARSQTTGQGTLTEKKGPLYGPEALDEQPRVTDLIPRRLPAYLLLLLAGAGAVCGMEALRAWAPKLLEAGAANADLVARALGRWFSSATLLAASATAVLVFAVRRYRTDDYRGCYRIWLWAALCWFAMSVDASGGLRDGFRNLMVQLTGTALHRNGDAWWAVPYLLVLGAVASRLLVDMRPARLSTAAMAAAVACLTAGVCFQAGWGTLGNVGWAAALERSAEVFGCWMLLLAALLHARYVVLDAEGLIPHVEPTAGERDSFIGGANEDLEADRPDEAGNQEWIAIDSPHRSPSPVLRRRTAAPTPAPVLDAASAEASLGRKLTKQEKKALRDRLMRQRLDREKDQQRKW